MNQITVNLTYVKSTIAATARSYGRRPAEIQLLAVSKRHPLDAILSAHAAGQTHFGENLVDEAVAKITAAPPDLTWHYIGQIQGNKTRAIARHFDWVHSVDRERVARRLSDQRESDTPLNTCVQVSTGGGEHRAGIAPGNALDLASAIHDLPGLALRGLMILPPPEPDESAQRAHFRVVAQLAEAGRQRGLPLTDLSMGMSGDWPAAVAEGATWIRLGTAIFGQRP